MRNRKRRARSDEEELGWQAWHKLIREAENGFPSEDSSEEVIVEITVVEVLGVGHVHMQPPEVTVVRDTEGKIWLLNETHTDDGELQGLVSRHNVRAGMKFRLRIKKVVHFGTRVFPLVPEGTFTL